MKIVSFQAENIKRLVAVRIDPKGNLVQLTGKNAQGKTSVLDAIWLALKVADVKQDKPVRDGQETGRIRLDLGELIVTRNFKVKDGETTTSISVTKADGAKYPSPQSMLDGLLSSLTFDPLAFSRMDGGAQVKAIRSLLPGVDFDGVAKQNKDDYDARTDINRKVRDLKGELTAIQKPTLEKGAARVDKKALVDKLGEAAEANALTETKKANRAKAVEENGVARQRAKDIVDAAKKALSDAEAEALELVAEAADTEKKIADAGPLPALVDITALRDQLNQADTNNAKIDEAEKFEAKAKQLSALEADSEKLTKAIDGRNEGLQKAVSSAKLPVDGLSFAEDSVLFNGIPFNQASDAEQLRVSVAIAMSLNPNLKVIRVRDGSLLDEDGLALLEKMAIENDYQIWIERVDGSGKVGFVLEDGHVTEAK